MVPDAQRLLVHSLSRGFRGQVLLRRVVDEHSHLVRNRCQAAQYLGECTDQRAVIGV